MCFINGIEWELLQKKRMKNASRPRLSGKVSTVRLTKGASMSRYERTETRVSRNKKY